jgi:enamine deaminase RidA (YjgF/YER057c/UK114 family)
MKIEQKLKEMGIELPSSPAPIANYVRYVQVGNILFVSGHGPSRDGKMVYTGKVGGDVSLDDAYQAARLTMLNCLASIKEAIGDLDRVKKIVKLLGMVNAVPEFGDQPKVINGASDLLVELFGPEIGKHARSAVGMGSLPNQITVEIEMIVEVA